MPMTGRTTVADGLKTILICFDSYDDYLMVGELYHSSSGDGKKFSNLMQLLFAIEDILNTMGFPKEATEKRRFTSMDSAVTGHESLGSSIDFHAKTGKLGTFKLKVMFRQNASWQGSVAWIEGSSEEPFRSVLELIMLINSALLESMPK